MKTLDALTVQLNKEKIEEILSDYPEVVVIGSRMTEEGYDLIVEGDDQEIQELFLELDQEMTLNVTDYGYI